MLTSLLEVRRNPKVSNGDELAVSFSDLFLGHRRDVLTELRSTDIFKDSGSFVFEPFNNIGGKER